MKRPERKDDYAEATDQLDGRWKSGEITQGEYDIKRARLIAEGSQPAPTAGVNFLKGLGLIIGLIIAIRVLLYVVTALGLA